MGGGGGGGGGLLDRFTQRRDRREGESERRQNIARDAANRETAKSTAAANNELQELYMRGGTPTEMVDKDLAIETDAGALGGESLKNQLMQDAGYNPMWQFNPYVGAYDYSSAAEGQMRDYAENLADTTVSDWEYSQHQKQNALEDSKEALQAERDEKADLFAEEVSEVEDDQWEIDARSLVEQWVASEKRAGAQYTARGRLGRKQGADNAGKADAIQSKLDLGYTYEEILRDTNIGDLISRNPETSAAYGNLMGSGERDEE